MMKYLQMKILKKDLVEKKGVEVGNTFHLESKYTDALELFYSDEKGEKQSIIMGCYGIGVSRLMGVIAELFADDKGLIWPENIAPFSLHLLSLGENDEAEKIYAQLLKNGVEVLFDDRDAQAGQKFADSDLIGIPYRAVISKKSLAAGGIEVKKRNESESKIMTVDELLNLLKK
ncbi:MAG: Proline-tRNA ligase [Candidatus Moranbacteria bacterium GW2011_GWD2_36_198]|nr:MAG: Proline-tRNA ligase [Candidatus Moranbacteria bacterium GW2011_GWD2_36_198]